MPDATMRFWIQFHTNDWSTASLPLCRLARAVCSMRVAALAICFARWRRCRPQLDLAGMDYSPAMLNRAKAKLACGKLTRGDLNCPIAYPDSTFDVVTCINVLFAVANMHDTLQELQRGAKARRHPNRFQPAGATADPGANSRACRDCRLDRNHTLTLSFESLALT